jgi:hypothetical protein
MVHAQDTDNRSPPVSTLYSLQNQRPCDSNGRMSPYGVATSYCRLNPLVAPPRRRSCCCKTGIPTGRSNAREDYSPLVAKGRGISSGQKRCPYGVNED